MTVATLMQNTIEAADAAGIEVRGRDSLKATAKRMHRLIRIASKIGRPWAS